MSIKKINQFPNGSGNLSNDDMFLFMDDPSGNAITKYISLSELSSSIGGGGGGGGGISNIVEDLTPQLGGNLDLNSYSINGTGSINLFGSGNFTQGLFVNNTGVSITGHSHTSSNISDFNTAVSGLLPVKNILSSGNITVSSTNQIFTIASSGLVKSDTTGITGASGVNNIVLISSGNYAAIPTPDPYTIYFVY